MTMARICKPIALIALMLTPGVMAQSAASPPKAPLVHVIPAEKPADMKTLLQQLRLGGYIFLVRHERTESPSVADDYSKPSHDCRWQRNLSPAGYAGATETRAIFRALAIPVHKVLSSPMCRTTETARQMFTFYEVDPRLMHEMDDQGRTNDVAATDLAAVLRETQPGNQNMALVTHLGVIQRATGIHLPEGGIAILRRDEKGQFIMIKTIMGSDLGPYARDALGPLTP